MKKLILSFCVLSFFSCSKTEIEKTDPGQTPAIEKLNLSSRTLGKGSSLPLELESLEPTGEVDFNSMSLEEIAAIHNDAMEYVVQKIVEDGSCPDDNEDFREKLSGYLEEFLATKGLISEIRINSIEQAKSFDAIDFCETDFKISEEARALSCNIENAFQEFETGKSTENVFSEKIEQVIESANGLADEDEKKIIQVTATICRSSSFFWKENLERLTSDIRQQCGKPIVAQKASVPWGGVAYADASGAITWGRVGFFAAGGPAGAVACGLAGAAGHSALRLLTFGIFGS